METLNTLFLGVTTLGIVVLVVALILLLLELRKALRAARPFVETVEKSLPAAIEEANLALKSLKDATDGAIRIMSDVREVSGAARAVGENVKRASDNVKRLSDNLESITSSFSGKVSGIRAGVAAALSVIQRGLRK
jgi:uncharacterized protein YoxC